MVTLFVSWEIPPVLVDPSSLPLKKKKKKKLNLNNELQLTVFLREIPNKALDVIFSYHKVLPLLAALSPLVFHPRSQGLFPTRPPALLAGGAG